MTHLKTSSATWVVARDVLICEEDFGNSLSSSRAACSTNIFVYKPQQPELAFSICCRDMAMPLIGFVLYALLGIAQIAAYLDGISLWLGVGKVFGLILFFVTAALPFGACIDTGIAFYGAYAAWHWPLWQAALLSFPFAIFGVAFIGVASVGNLFTKLSVSKAASQRRMTAMDATVKAIYGNNNKVKTADLEQSVLLADEMLLCGAVPLAEVRSLAKGLYEGPMPYSTIDLAVATALAFYRNKRFFSALEPHQLLARHHVLNWVQNRKINLVLAEAFENSLYRDYKPRS